MRRFLQLCEQLNPEYSDSPKWKLVDFLKEKGINVSLVRNTDMLYIDTGTETIVVTVTDNETAEAPEEEAESIDADYGDYDVNQEVQGLAATAQSGLKGVAQKLFGNSAQQAKSAVQKRQGVVKQAIGVYDKKTQKLSSDLRNIR